MKNLLLENERGHQLIRLINVVSITYTITSIVNITSRCSTVEGHSDIVSEKQSF